MLGAAGHEDPAVADHAGDQTRDRAADMALGVDVGVVEHGVPTTANFSASIRLAFHQHGRDPACVCRRDLRLGGDIEIGQHIDDGADVEIAANPQVSAADAPRIATVLVKCEPDRRGKIRGNRHTMLDDTDINAQRHVRGAVAGLVAGVIGDGRIFVSGGAEHQGPDGGGLIAVIAAPKEGNA